MFKRMAYFLVCLGLIGQHTAMAQQVVVNGNPRIIVAQLAKKGAVRTLQQMQRSGYSLDVQDQYGNTALCQAVLEKDPQSFRILQSLGASTSHDCMKRIPMEDREEFLKAYRSQYPTTVAEPTSSTVVPGVEDTFWGLSAQGWAMVGVGAVLAGGAAAIAGGISGGGGGSDHDGPCDGVKCGDNAVCSLGACVCVTGFTGNAQKGCTAITCSANEYLSGNDCLKCPAGEENPDGIGSCTACPANSYSTGHGESCQVCGANSTAPAASTSAGDCVCNADYYGMNGNCSACPENMKSNIGSTSLSQCYCPAPYDLDAGGSCVLKTSCAANSYWGGTNVGCKMCPTGSVSPAGSIGAGSCSQCTAGTRVSGSECVTCEGNSISAAGATTCTACPSHAFANSSKTECLCEAGYKMSGGQCILCGEHEISSQGATTCQMCGDNEIANATHTQCEAVVCTNGYIANHTCNICPAGKELNGSKTGCDDCQTGWTSTAGSACQKCNPGYTSTDGINCTACSANTKEVAGECKLCDTNYVSDAGSTTCRCPTEAGYVEDESGCRLKTGDDCAAGTYLDGTVCTACPVNTYESGHTCHACSEHWTTGGAIGQTSCTVCPEPYVSEGDQCRDKKASDCAAGEYLDGTTCTKCPAGKYEVNNVCQDCTGNWTSTEGSTSCTVCPEPYIDDGENCREKKASDCAAGTYLDGTVCTACPVNTYESGHTCHACSEHWTTGGAIGQTSCTVCPEPYIDDGVNCREKMAYDCTAGQYFDSGECKACPANSTSEAHQTGISACFCNANYYGSDGVCTKCESNKISDAGSTSAEDCHCESGKEFVGGLCVAPEDCAAGKHWVTNQGCQECQGDTWSLGGGTDCQACPDGATGMSGHTMCSCPVGSKWNNGACDPITVNDCLAGTYFNGTVCTACPSDSMSEDHATSCYCKADSYGTAGSCTQCTGGKHAPAGSTSESACVCTGEGEEDVNGVCTVPSDCGAGQYWVANQGCQLCPEGQYKDSTMNACAACPSGVSTEDRTSCDCGEHGAFVGGQCTCEADYYPSGSGTCVSGADWCTQYNATSTGTLCQCNGGFGGVDFAFGAAGSCTACQDGQVAIAEGSGRTCTFCASYKGSDHWTSNEAHTTCVCKEGWTGKDCTISANNETVQKDTSDVKNGVLMGYTQMNGYNALSQTAITGLDDENNMVKADETATIDVEYSGTTANEIYGMYGDNGSFMTNASVVGHQGETRTAEGNIDIDVTNKSGSSAGSTYGIYMSVAETATGRKYRDSSDNYDAVMATNGANATATADRAGANSTATGNITITQVNESNQNRDVFGIYVNNGSTKESKANAIISANALNAGALTGRNYSAWVLDPVAIATGNITITQTGNGDVYGLYSANGRMQDSAGNMYSNASIFSHGYFNATTAVGNAIAGAGHFNTSVDNSYNLNSMRAEAHGNVSLTQNGKGAMYGLYGKDLNGLTARVDEHTANLVRLALTAVNALAGVGDDDYNPSKSNFSHILTGYAVGDVCLTQNQSGNNAGDMVGIYTVGSGANAYAMASGATGSYQQERALAQGNITVTKMNPNGTASGGYMAGMQSSTERQANIYNTVLDKGDASCSMGARVYGKIDVRNGVSDETTALADVAGTGVKNVTMIGMDGGKGETLNAYQVQKGTLTSVTEILPANPDTVITGLVNVTSVGTGAMYGMKSENRVQNAVFIADTSFSTRARVNVLNVSYNASAGTYNTQSLYGLYSDKEAYNIRFDTKASGVSEASVTVTGDGTGALYGIYAPKVYNGNTITDNSSQLVTKQNLNPTVTVRSKQASAYGLYGTSGEIKNFGTVKGVTTTTDANAKLVGIYAAGGTSGASQQVYQNGWIQLSRNEISYDPVHDGSWSLSQNVGGIMAGIEGGDYVTISGDSASKRSQNAPSITVGDETNYAAKAFGIKLGRNATLTDYSDTASVFNVVANGQKTVGIQAKDGVNMTLNNKNVLTVTGDELAVGIEIGAQDGTGNNTLVNNGNMDVTASGTGGYGYGILVHAGTAGSTNVTNTGDITVNATNAYGIYVDGYDANRVTITNSGTITLNGSSCSDCDGSEPRGNYIVLNGATMETSGLLQASVPVNTNSFGGQVNLAQGGGIAAPAVSGQIGVASSVVMSGFGNTYTLHNAIQSPDTTGLSLASKSALFDAKLSGEDIVMEMKGFDTATKNKSLAHFLTRNYGSGKNEGLFRTLKAFGSAKELTNAVNKMSGKDMFSRFTFEDMTMMRELNLDMNKHLFANKAAHLSIGGSVSSPMAFRGDNGSNSRYSLTSKSDGATSVGLGIAFTDTRSDDDHDGNNRSETMYQMIVPIGFKTNGVHFITSPRLGYARGEYDRTGYENRSYDGEIEKRVFGLMNEARYPITIGKVKVEPAAEFNMLGYEQKGRENNKEYSLRIPKQRTYSVEGGVGVYLSSDMEFADGTTFKPMMGVAAYHEFADPYKMEVGMNGMDGFFTLRDEKRSDNRAVMRAGFDLDHTRYSIYGVVVSYLDREARTKANMGMKWKF